jgi:hypothetical protein
VLGPGALDGRLDIADGSYFASTLPAAAGWRGLAAAVSTVTNGGS